MKNSIQKTTLVVVALSSLVVSANAQWVGSSIHPAGFSQSYVNGAAEGIAVGSAGSPDSGAGYWLNSGATFVSLDEAAWTFSVMYQGNATTQVGSFTQGFTNHACKWNGTKASFEDLNPSRSTDSQALAISGNLIGGYARFNNDSHAVIWNGGGAEDFTDLHPNSAIWSTVSAMTGSTQVGTVTLAGLANHAGIWNGTAASFVDLAPVGSDESNGGAAAGNRQGGWSNIAGQERHAYLWSGTAASGIDLNPAGELASEVLGMSNSFQVGYSYNGGTQFSSAQIWSGTAASAVNLGAFLPADFVSSHATSVVEYADRTEVYGYGYRRGSNVSEALMWTQPVPEPSAILAISLGVLALARTRRRR